MPTMLRGKINGRPIPEVAAEDRNMKFMMAGLALALLESLRGEEKDKTAAYNRLAGAAESTIKVCDLYLPGAINQTSLNKMWEVLDGPVLDVLRQHQHIFELAVAEATHKTQEV